MSDHRRLRKRSTRCSLLQPLALPREAEPQCGASPFNRRSSKRTRPFKHPARIAQHADATSSFQSRRAPAQRSSSAVSPPARAVRSARCSARAARLRGRRARRRSGRSSHRLRGQCFPKRGARALRTDERPSSTESPACQARVGLPSGSFKPEGTLVPHRRCDHTVNSIVEAVEVCWSHSARHTSKRKP